MHAATIDVANEVAPMAVLWPFLLAGGVYLLLRWTIRRRGGDFPALASRHAFLTGLIAWLGSSLLSAANAGILPVPGSPTASVDKFPALAWPVLGCLVAHAQGQLSYPKAKLGQPTGTKRRIRDVLPRRLAWTVLVIFAGAAAQISWTSTLPGFAPLSYESRPDGHGGYTTFGGEGRIPGAELAAYLGVALLVLAAGTLVLLALAAHRPPLAGLSTEDDVLLRTITMNRLLRTVATVASGLAAIAGNHAVRPDPEIGHGSWLNPAGAANLAVLLVMLLWSPPKLNAPRARLGAGSTAAQPATKLSVSIGAAMGLAAFVPVPAALFFPWAVAGDPAVFVAVSAASVLAVVSLGEVLLHRNHSTANGTRSWPRLPISPILLSTLVVSAGVLATVVVAVAGQQAALGRQPSWGTTCWTSAGITLLSLVPMVLARRRYSVAAAVAGLDTALRAITVHRVVRTLAAFFAAQAGALLMSAGPKLPTASPLGPEPGDAMWQAASGVGAVLAAVGVVIAVIPVGGAAGRAAQGPRSADEHGPAPRPVRS
ncbi:hypothetical protein ACTAQI_10545 [Pseudarthrobacter sp. alpha12b]